MEKYLHYTHTHNFSAAALLSWAHFLVVVVILLIFVSFCANLHNFLSFHSLLLLTRLSIISSFTVVELFQLFSFLLFLRRFLRAAFPAIINRRPLWHALNVVAMSCSYYISNYSMLIDVSITANCSCLIESLPDPLKIKLNFLNLKILQTFCNHTKLFLYLLKFNFMQTPLTHWYDYRPTKRQENEKIEKWDISKFRSSLFLLFAIFLLTLLFFFCWPFHVSSTNRQKRKFSSWENRRMSM